MRKNLHYLVLPQLRFDVGIAPVEINRFSCCKSWLKYLEYTLAGAVTVASPLPDMERAIQHGRNGFLIRKNRHREWLKTLEQLVDDQELRRQVYEEARADVLAKHDIDLHWTRYEEAFLRIIDHHKSTMVKR